jgi:hypothetical protein
MSKSTRQTPNGGIPDQTKTGQPSPVMDLETAMLVDAVAEIRHLADRFQEQVNVLVAQSIQTQSTRTATKALARMRDQLREILTEAQ